jgi:isoleucyl-tRNA synthetase
MRPFFPEFGNEYKFASSEEAVLAFWKEHRVFQRILQERGDRKWFGFYDGPPFATGLPHYGHLLAGTIKDMVPRYWTMRGFHVERRFGWDCHGLPVEFEMEKTLQLNGSLAIREYGVDRFNEACRGIVLRYTGEWRRTVERMGRWVDLDNDYKTMNPDFMESVWWAFSELWNKGLVYQGKKVVPYSWRLTAPLSNFEASQNYKSVQDPSISVLFSLKRDPSQGFVAWTTTPWTLPANLALTVNSDYQYQRFPLKNTGKGVNSAWVAKSRAEAYGKELDLTQLLEEKTGSQLEGEVYVPLFPFYESSREKAFRVLVGTYVTAEDGSGIVHTAPAFGEDDFQSAATAGIELVDPTDLEGRYTSELIDIPGLSLQGKQVKDPNTDKEIVQWIKAQGRLLKQEVLQHNYPFCERSDTPLIYKAISSWFVSVEQIKDRMQEHNRGIRWVPEHIRDGRFGKWLENARDWCISRNRFWGTPIPVWICQKCGEKKVIGSRAELNAFAGRDVPDLHSHYVDEIKGDCEKCGAAQSMIRTPEVLDCWFESGSMPFAQVHYPFEGKDDFAQQFPATFIAEGLDQTRGWFYTLTVLSTALFDKPAFRNCVVNGLVLAEDGKKMSKRLRNYPDPNSLIDKYGADAIRLYMMQSPAVHGEELRFSEKNMLETVRAVLLPLWNSYQFFATYANIDGFHPEWRSKAPDQRPKIDRWILASLSATEIAVHKEMEQYHLAQVFPHLSRFFDQLTNWHIRLSRPRFWESKEQGFSPEKLSAYCTLHEVLERVSLLLAPYLPFFAEYLHGALVHGKSPTDLKETGALSVHERRISPENHLSREEIEVMEEMAIVQRAILLGRSLRAEAQIGLRQPLLALRLAGLQKKDRESVEKNLDLVRSELNLKNIEFLNDGSGLVEESVRPNLKRLGAKLGKKMAEVQNALKAWSSREVQEFEKSGSALVCGVQLGPEDLLIDRKAAPGKRAGALEGLVGELDVTITPELHREGLLREFVNRVQQLRKDAKLLLTDRIQVEFRASGLCKEILQSESFSATFLSQETLAQNFSSVEDAALEAEEFGADGMVGFRVRKA